MAKAADRPSTPAPERVPGDFARHPGTGAPYVTHPTETTKRTGTKAELIVECAAAGIAVPEKATCAVLQELLGPRPKMVQYGRPSSLGKQIENQTNLQKWSERMVALGLGRDSVLHEDAINLASLDEGSPEFKELADSIARRAKTVAQAHLAAERGTHHHELTEDHDLDRDPVLRMAAGEDLGVPEPVQRALVAAWALALKRFDIEILATEARCVDDVWRQAGTLDRICRLRRELRFITTTGEYVTLPAGWVGILDIKTGRLRLADSGFVAYWHGYAVQLASYAQSVPYDADTGVRGVWPWTIDQRWAVIAHLDILAALDGEAVCRLVLVDLEAGRIAGALAVAAKSWEKRTDVFSIPVDDLAVRVAVDSLAHDGLPTNPEFDVDDQIPSVGEVTRLASPAEEPSEVLPSTAVEVARLEPSVLVAPAGDLYPAEQLAAAGQRPAPDEGGEIADGFEDLQARYIALGAKDSPARLWIKELTEQSIAAGVSFHSSGNRTLRRYEIIRGLLILAQADVCDDDALRGLLELVVGDVAQFPSVPAGHIVGSLSAGEARQFADYCDRFVNAQIPVTVRPDGTFSLEVAAA